ncbi:MAG TPA: error-prone DNA polymerase [Rhodopila sp.]|nr:error-prone DNA polymerase [Rhodopila sp.]
MADYAELQVTSNYSFLRGASHVEELLGEARRLGLPAIGLTDRNTLAGMARAHQRAEEAGIRLVVGCRLDLRDDLPVLVYPTNRAAYARLCALLSLGKRRAGKGGCDLTWADLAERAEGLLAVLLPEAAASLLPPALPDRLARLAKDFPGRAYLALTIRRRPRDAERLRRLSILARTAGVPTVATGDVLYHDPHRRILQDVLTCIREGCTIDEVGFRRERSVDRALKSPAEMRRQFAAYPDAVARSLEIVERCRFSLSDLCYQYPHETVDPSRTAQQTLAELVRDGAAWRYPHGVPDVVEQQLRNELALIERLDYAPYFLTVHSIVRYARSQQILCQGRGSAANSAVCYVLGITAIDPIESGLLFERFVSAERKEPPDIDVDFDHEKREDVIQWIYDHYGRDKAALCATVIRYRARGAVRDVGKALGLTEDVTKAIASQLWEWSRDGVHEDRLTELNLDPRDLRLRLTIELAQTLIGFPRHLSQHPGGFVLTCDRLDALVPVEPAAMKDRQVIEWDKDDIDILRWVKVDVLGLGMLGCMRRAFDLLRTHHGVPMDLASVPKADSATYAMIQKADTLGVFQIESRAQMTMLPRLKPATLYDLVIEIAIVRPGPIQGDMVHPYLRRREGKEPVFYPKPELEHVLGKTLGVPLFQEQAMRVAMVCAGFSATEADQLRRSMATFKVTGGVSHFRDRLIAGMEANGYSRDFAEQTITQIEGFGSYGFPESHAASFALIAYASSWMKCHYPDVFCCALLNAQPMGFYAPAQIVRDAREHGVVVRPVCVNHSQWDCTLEPIAGGPGEPVEESLGVEEGLGEGRLFAVRLGMRMVKGLSKVQAQAIVDARGNEPYRSPEVLWRRAGVPHAALQRLAEADALRALEVDRRAALWAVRGLPDTVLPLFAAADAGRPPEPELTEPTVTLTPLTAGRSVVQDYASVGLSLRGHPVSFLRADLRARGITPCGLLTDRRDGQHLTVAGLVLVRQRPGTATGVVFITVEDETGIANLVVWSDVFDRQRRTILSAGMLSCRGRLQREGDVIHVVAEQLEDLTPLLRQVGQRHEGRDQAFPPPHGRGDETVHPNGPDPRLAAARKPALRQRTRDFR